MKTRCLTFAFLLSLAAIAAGFALVLEPGAGLIAGGAIGAWLVYRLDATSSSEAGA